MKHLNVTHQDYKPESEKRLIGKNEIIVKKFPGQPMVINLEQC